jgi:uncharacterized tellurite resistance protein B-like protein
MVYKDVFQTEVECSEELTPNEAIFAIGLMVMIVDGEIDNNEVEILEGFLLRKGLSVKEVNEAREKVLRIKNNESEAALFNAAKKAVPEPEQIEATIDLAVKVALADNKVTTEERSFVTELANALNVSHEDFDRIVEHAKRKFSSHQKPLERIEEILSLLPAGTVYEGFSVAKNAYSFYNIKLRAPSGQMLVLNIDEIEENQLDIDIEMAPPWMGQ